MNNTIISYESHLITTQFRSGFYIYERSFCLMLYNIAMIQHYSRCVIRQLLWLRSTYPNVLFRLGFYMCSLQELSANWLPRQAPDRGTPGAREHITRESHDNRPRHILLGPWGTRGILMYKVFPRNLFSTECHTIANDVGRLRWFGAWRSDHICALWTVSGVRVPIVFACVCVAIWFCFPARSDIASDCVGFRDFLSAWGGDLCRRSAYGFGRWPFIRVRTTGLSVSILWVRRTAVVGWESSVWLTASSSTISGVRRSPGVGLAPRLFADILSDRLGKDQAMAVAINLQRYAGIMLSNLQILSQFATALHSMSFQMMALGIEQSLFPRAEVDDFSPVPRAARAASYMINQPEGKPLVINANAVKGIPRRWMRRRRTKLFFSLLWGWADSENIERIVLTMI